MPGMSGGQAFGLTKPGMCFWPGSVDDESGATPSRRSPMRRVAVIRHMEAHSGSQREPPTIAQFNVNFALKNIKDMSAITPVIRDVARLVVDQAGAQAAANDSSRRTRMHPRDGFRRSEDRRGHRRSRSGWRASGSRRSEPPIRIAITADYLASCSTLPEGGFYGPSIVGTANAHPHRGGVLDRLRAMRRPGESYSDVILRLASSV